MGLLKFGVGESRKPRQPAPSARRSALDEGAFYHRQGLNCLSKKAHLNAAAFFLQAAHAFAGQRHDGGVRESLYQAEEAFRQVDAAYDRDRANGILLDALQSYRRLLRSALKAASSSCLKPTEREDFTAVFAGRLEWLEERFGKG